MFSLLRRANIPSRVAQPLRHNKGDYLSYNPPIKFCMSNSKGRFAPYRHALSAISGRTGVPLPSLIFSFAVLHELSAIVPIVGIFYTARSLGAGERVVNAIAANRDGSTDDQSSWVNTQLKSW